MDKGEWRRALARALSVGLIVVLGGGALPGCRQAGEAGAASTDAEAAENGEEGTDEQESDGEDGAAEEDEEEAVPVSVAALERGPIESVLRFSTNLEAEKQVQVLAEATRTVEALMVEEGDRVARGQLLVRLEDDEQRNELARIESQLTRAERELARQKNLFEQQLISEQAYNDARYDVEQLGIALADAKRELSYTEVRAPIAGTVTQRLVKVGDFVTVNQHLFDIIDFGSIVARVYVPEKELPRIAVGQAARILVQSPGAEERHGVIDRIAPVVDSRSGTVKVTVAIPAEEGLLPGMYVSVELVTEVHQDALLVPKRALIYDDDQLFVFRVGEDDRVERLLLRPVLEDRTFIEPAGGLLEPGDRIVVAGQAGLKDGSLVRDVAAPREPEERGGERATS